MTAEILVQPIPHITSDIVSQQSSLFTRAWPPAAVGIALLLTIVWTGFLGYGLFKLAEPALFWFIS
jgi:hypothetical protein